MDFQWFYLDKFNLSIGENFVVYYCNVFPIGSILPFEEKYFVTVPYTLIEDVLNKNRILGGFLKAK